MGKESRRRAGGATASATAEDQVAALLEEADDLFAQEEYERGVLGALPACRSLAHAAWLQRCR